MEIYAIKMVSDHYHTRGYVNDRVWGYVNDPQVAAESLRITHSAWNGVSIIIRDLNITVKTKTETIAEFVLEPIVVMTKADHL